MLFFHFLPSNKSQKNITPSKIYFDHYVFLDMGGLVIVPTSNSNRPAFYTHPVCLLLCNKPQIHLKTLPALYKTHLTLQRVVTLLKTVLSAANVENSIKAFQ